MSISSVGSNSNAFAALGQKWGGMNTKKSEGPSPEQEFLDYAQKSPAERIRDAILKEMGLTEEDLEKMSPTELKKVEKEIAERVQEKLKQSTQNATGVLVDIQA